MIPRLVAFAVLGTATATPAFAASSDATVLIRNRSSWDIHQLFISPVGEDEWGEDQLGDEIVSADGGKFTLTDIPCGAYDVRLVDEDGDECVVGDVGLCAGKGDWVVDDDNLLACQAETE